MIALLKIKICPRTLKVFAGLSKGLGISLLLFNSCLNSNAQTQKSWQWINHLGGKAWDLTTGLAIDHKNQVSILGNFSDTLVCDRKKIASAGSQDIFLARYNEKGNLNDLWRFGGKGFDQANCFGISPKGTLLLGGSVYNDLLNIDSEDVPKNRLFVSCLSNKGAVLWQSFLVPEGEASLYLLSEGKEDDLFVAGIYSGKLSVEDTTLTSAGKNDIFLGHFNSDGSLKSIVSLGGIGDDRPTALLANDTCIFLSGTFENSFSIDSTDISPSNGNSHGFILAFSTTFKPIWKIQLDGEQYLNIASLQSDAQGNLYAAGSFDLKLQFDHVSLESAGHTDGFIGKINPKGKSIWVKSFGTMQYEYSFNLIRDNLDGMVITGMLGDTLLIDNQSLFPVSENSALALQYDSSGTVIWGDCISGEGSNFGDASILDLKGNLYLAGSFSGRLGKEMLNIPSFGDQDLFVAKYYNCENSTGQIMGNDCICPGTFTELYVKSDFTKIIWNDSITDAYSIQVANPGIYTVSMLDKHGCIVDDTLEVKLAPFSDFTLGNDISLPIESDLKLIGPENYRNYLWQDQSSESSLIARADINNPGKYIFWLVATDSLGCQMSDSIAIDFYKSAGWVDVSKVNIACYPNPVKEWLTWTVNATESCAFNIEILDANGRNQFNEHIGNYEPGSEMKLSFEPFPSGVYYLQIKDGAGRVSKTVCVIKQ